MALEWQENNTNAAAPKQPGEQAETEESPV
jgi:hypothetical protein